MWSFGEQWLLETGKISLLFILAISSFIIAELEENSKIKYTEDISYYETFLC